MPALLSWLSVHELCTNHILHIAYFTAAGQAYDLYFGGALKQEQLSIYSEFS